MSGKLKQNLAECASWRQNTSEAFRGQNMGILDRLCPRCPLLHTQLCPDTHTITTKCPYYFRQAACSQDWLYFRGLAENYWYTIVQHIGHHGESKTLHWSHHKVVFVKYLVLEHGHKPSSRRLPFTVVCIWNQKSTTITSTSITYFTKLRPFPSVNHVSHQLSTEVEGTCYLYTDWRDQVVIFQIKVDGANQLISYDSSLHLGSLDFCSLRGQHCQHNLLVNTTDLQVKGQVIVKSHHYRHWCDQALKVQCVRFSGF